MRTQMPQLKMKANRGYISEIIDWKDSGRPVLVNFVHGNINNDKIEDVASQLFRDKSGNITAATATEKDVYLPHILKKVKTNNNYILIRNKNTGKCKLIAVDTAVLSMKTKPKMTGNISTLPQQNKLDDLNKNFGSKRIKMITVQKERLNVNVESIKTTLEQTAKDTNVDVSDMVQLDVTDSDSMCRPPINRGASKVENVYALHTLIPQQLLDELKPTVKQLLATEENDLKLCDFVKYQFTKLQRTESSGNEIRAQLLIYIDCLISLFKQQAKAISNKKFVACSYSSNVSAHILDNFTLISATGRTRPLSMRDKCVCYILVLSMLACNNVLNLEVLAKELKLGLKKLQELSRVLAFSSKSNDKNNVTLRLPLPPPVIPSSRKRKR